MCTHGHKQMQAWAISSMQAPAAQAQAGAGCQLASSGGTGGRANVWPVGAELAGKRLAAPTQASPVEVSSPERAVQQHARQGHGGARPLLNDVLRMRAPPTCCLQCLHLRCTLPDACSCPCCPLLHPCSLPQLAHFKAYELSSLLFALAQWDAAALLAQSRQPGAAGARTQSAGPISGPSTSPGTNPAMQASERSEGLSGAGAGSGEEKGGVRGRSPWAGRGGAGRAAQQSGNGGTLGQLLGGAAARLDAEVAAGPGYDLPAALHSVWALVKLGHPVQHSLLAALAAQLQHSHVCGAGAGAGPPGSSSSSSSSKGQQREGPADVDKAMSGEPRPDGALDDAGLAHFVWACSVSGFQPRALLDAYSEALCARLGHPDLKPLQVWPGRGGVCVGVRTHVCKCACTCVRARACVGPPQLGHAPPQPTTAQP